MIRKSCELFNFGIVTDNISVVELLRECSFFYLIPVTTKSRWRVPLLLSRQNVENVISRKNQANLICVIKRQFSTLSEIILDQNKVVAFLDHILMWFLLAWQGVNQHLNQDRASLYVLMHNGYCQFSSGHTMAFLKETGLCFNELPSKAPKIIAMQACICIICPCCHSHRSIFLRETLPLRDALF